MYMNVIKLLAKNEKKITREPNTDCYTIESEHKDWIWHKNICHANCYICECQNTITNNVYYRRFIPRWIWCLCVCNTSMTDIVEKWIDYSQLTWLEHLFTRTNTFWWYAIHLSIWVELCVTAPTGKGKLIPHLFTPIWSHPSFMMPPVISSRSSIYTWELKTVGFKRRGGNSAWNRKGCSSL